MPRIESVVPELGGVAGDGESVEVVQHGRTSFAASDQTEPFEVAQGGHIAARRIGQFIDGERHTGILLHHRQGLGRRFVPDDLFALAVVGNNLDRHVVADQVDCVCIVVGMASDVGLFDLTLGRSVGRIIGGDQPDRRLAGADVDYLSE